MLNFNVDPYRDDFDPSKHFHRILFKPGRAVQARELTQAQTILQDQISKFANHLFTQNTPITGGHVTINTNCYYLKLNRTYSGINVDVYNFLNRIIRDSTGTILAKVIAVAEETSSDGVITEPPTLIISYISGLMFTNSDIIYSADDSNFIAQILSSNATGKSSAAHISDGVFYIVNGYSYSSTPNPDGTYSKYTIGNFVSVDSQSTILEKYGSSPNLRVGLNITETIYDYVDDVSLLDPALGSSNYQAPGADRYVIRLDLETRPLTLGDDQGFIELVRLENGKIKKQVDNTVYSVIDDYFAKRTYDTNGDYIVSPFTLTPVANTSNSSSFGISVSKGIAYIRGYRVENQSDVLLPVEKARSNTTISRNNISIDYGSYIYLSNVSGSAANNVSTTQNIDPSVFQTIDLHCVNKANIASANSSTYNSTLVATAKLRNLTYDSSANTSDTKSYVYKAFICDVSTKVLQSNVKSFSNNSVTFYDDSYKFSSANNAYNGATLTLATGDRVRVSFYDGNSKTAYVIPDIKTSLSTSTQLYLNLDVKDAETFTISNSTYAVVSSAEINAKGKSGGSVTGDTLVFDSSYPELLFKVGYPYVRNILDSSYSTQKVFRRKNFYDDSGTAKLAVAFDPSLNPVLNFQGRTAPAYLSSDEILNYYTVIVRNRGNNPSINNGDILDFTSGSRTVQISSDGNTITFVAPDLDALSSTLSVDVIAKVYVNNADDSLILKTKTLVNGDTSTVRANTGYSSAVANTFVHLSYGQVYIKNSDLVTPGNKQSLYVCDVKKVIKIIDTLSPNTAPTLSMLSDSSYDVSNFYQLNNGQTDNYYDHSSLALRPGASQPRGNILVIFDYYSHGASGDGYFSVMSYLGEEYSEIGNYTSKSGIQYSLRDCLDFRPARVNGTSTFTFRLSTDPSTTDSGIYVPQFLSNFVSDYSYYIGRKDLVVLTKDNNFQVIKGTPSLSPSYPSSPDGSLLIGKLALDPYTAYIPGQNPIGTLPNLSIELVQHKRWTMQDISDLQTRVSNLEKHTNLSLLEQKAQNMQVPDSYGINRFKNGILVDDFASFASADTFNPEFSASINKRSTYMTASYKIKNFPLQSITALRTMGKIATQPLNYKIHTDVENNFTFTLPYTPLNVVVQQLASNTVSVNPFNTASHKGILSLNPPMDNWVDSDKAPDLLMVDPSLQVFQRSETNNILNMGDWKSIPGTKLTAPTTSLTSSVNLETSSTETLSTVTSPTYNINSQNYDIATHAMLDNSLSIDNNYVKDISVLPYIRPQEILVKADGLSINTPLTVTFDGIDVKNYMTSTDVIELSGVTGQFKEGDVLGFYDENVFYPMAIVVDYLVYPTDNTKVRLYVTSNYHSNFSTDFPITSLRNGYFDSTGVYVNSTASGNTTSNTIINVHKSGMISSVGGAFVDYDYHSINYYKVWVGGQYGAFASAYGVWGDPGAGDYGMLGATNILRPGKFTFTAPHAGNYYLRWASDDDQRGYVKVDSVTILGNAGGTAPIGPSGIASFGGDITLNLSAGTHTIEMYAYTDESALGMDGDQFLAVAISTGPWVGNGSYENSKIAPAGHEGSLVFSTASVKANTYSVTAGSSVVEMPGGGLYHTGATEVSLSGLANTTNTFYVGSTITFESTLVSSDVYGTNTVTPHFYTSNVVSYTANTRTVILDTPVNLSVGFNNIIGNLDLTSSYSINGTDSCYSLAQQNGTLSRLSTDEAGSFNAILNIPKGMFKAGEKVFRIDNRTSFGDVGSSTTFAEATFVASGLSSRVNSQDFSPSPSGAKSTFTRTALNNNLNTTSSVNASGPSKNDPMAQTFIIGKDLYPNGLFLSSISLFFRSKPTNPSVAPISLSIVGTQNGYPNGESLDYSVVVKDPTEVNVSTSPHYLDSSTATTFEFSSPVYIQSGVLYAILLTSDSSEYKIYVASQGSDAIPSSVKNKPTDQTPTNITKIGNTPYVGSLFEFQNGATWSPNSSKSLMMAINRCVFSKTSGTVQFTIPENLPYRKSYSNELRYFIDPKSASGLGSAFAGTDIKSDAFNVTTTDLVPTSTAINYSYVGTLDSNKSTSGEYAISPGKYACPNPEDIYLSDSLGERILLANSNSSFVLNCVLNTNDDSVSPIISDNGLALYNIEWNINNLGLNASQLRIDNGGIGYSQNTQLTTVTISSNYVGGGRQATANAVVDASGSLRGIDIIDSGAGYLYPPTITINGANTSPANCRFLSEFSPSGGNAICKYFTKRVVLTPGNDSQDLRVFYTAYRPLGSEIYVFYKILSGSDTSNFDDLNWQLMTSTGSNRNIYSKNRTDIIEYEAAPGIAGTANNYVSYTGTNGQLYKDFAQFAIKIVLVTSDKTTVPFLGDLRAIALPSDS